MNSPSSDVAPGWWAFVAFFFLAVGLWLLMRNMFARLRRMTIAEQGQRRGQVAREAAARDGRGDEGEVRGGSADPADPHGP